MLLSTDFNWHLEAQRHISQRPVVIVWAVLCLTVLVVWFVKEVRAGTRKDAAK